MSRDTALVTAEWVEDHLDDPKIVLIEVDEDTTAYDKGHIRGAIKLDWTTDLQDQVRRDFVNKAQFEALLSAQGRRERRHRRALRRQQQLVRGLRLLVLQALRPPGRQAPRRRPQEVGARQPRARPTRPPTPRGHVVHREGAGPLDPRVPRRDRRGDRRQEPRRRPQPRRVRRPAARPGPPAAGAGAARGPHPDRGERPVEQGCQRRRHLPRPTTSSRSSTPRPASTGPRTPSPTAASASARAHTWFVLHELLGQENVKNYDGSWTEYGSLVGVPGRPRRRAGRGLMCGATDRRPLPRRCRRRQGGGDPGHRHA